MAWYSNYLKKKGIKVPRQNKYKNVKVEYDGYSFPSKGHAHCYSILKLQEKAGEIQLLQVEDNVRLSEAKILYIVDFKCLDLKTNKEFWVEFKGFETPQWRIKLRLWEHYGPGDLHIYKATYRNGSISVYLDQIVKR